MLGAPHSIHLLLVSGSGRAAFGAAAGRRDHLLQPGQLAGALSGNFRNQLGWTVGGGEIHGKPVAWIRVAAPMGGEAPCASMRTVLGYVDAGILEAECVRLHVRRPTPPRGGAGPGRS